jgi:hypothetical protein
MGAGKNKSHRKNRISKHVLQAEERKNLLAEQEAIAAGGGGIAPTKASVVVVPASATTTTTTTTQKKKKNKKKKNDTIKDPEEASSYLSLWKHDRNGAWKFNKNTQSWLLRHMYDHARVSKTSFATLVEYVSSSSAGGGDGVVKSRTMEDAKRRARRYKEWEKKGGG